MRLEDFNPHPIPLGGGEIALSPMPGRTRHYRTDWEALVAWRPALVLTMTTQAELDRKGAGTLGADCRAAGIGWHHLPIEDFWAPGPETASAWPAASAAAHAALARGGRVLIHCFGGCGRSGMAALRLMIEAGEVPEAALARLRAARPCAVETDAQRAWAEERAT